MLCQVAKALVHIVVGSVGSPANVAYLTEVLGIDRAFDYHTGTRSTSC
jgi:NADPH-dependent curcumin reductase CurA